MVIQYKAFKLIKNLLFLLLLSCNDTLHFKNYETGEIILPSGETLTIYLADTPDKQAQGLSHIKPSEFKDNEGMFFYGTKDSLRQFWMPETFFDLDIIFLNKDLYVLEVDKAVKHFEKRIPEHLVPRAKAVTARHVLEIKASSPLASKIEPGMMLKWLKKPNLLQKERETLPSQ